MKYKDSNHKEQTNLFEFEEEDGTKRSNANTETD